MKKSIQSIVLSLIISLILFPATVQAQTESTASTEAVDVTALRTEGPATEDPEAWHKKLALSYWGIFSGPSLSQDVSSSYVPDDKGEASDPLNFNGAISAGYRVTKDVVAGVGLPFVYRPGEQQGTTRGDSYLRLSHGRFINSGAFNMSMGARFYAPTTPESRNRGYRGGIRLEENLTYDVNPRLQLGTFTFISGNSFAEDATSGTAMTIYAAPYLSYQLRDKLSATLWCDLVQLSSPRGSANGYFMNAPVGLQPGLNWDLADGVSLNPYINVYPENLSLKSSSIAMILSLKAL